MECERCWKLYAKVLDKRDALCTRSEKGRVNGIGSVSHRVGAFWLHEELSKYRAYKNYCI